jgi:hypothetical protein
MNIVKIIIKGFLKVTTVIGAICVSLYKFPNSVALNYIKIDEEVSRKIF